MSSKTRQRPARFAAVLLLFFAVALAPGCGGKRAVLGDGSISGVLPPGWQEKKPGTNIVRIVDTTQPMSWEILIYGGPADIKESRSKDWVFVKVENRSVGALMVHGQLQELTREFRIYQRLFPDGRPLEIAVDNRFDTAKTRRFLESLKPVKEK